MRKRTLWGMAVVALLVLGFVGWSAWQANEVRKDLFAAKADALALKAALQTGDQAAAESHLDSFAKHSEAARDRTDGALWSVLGALPVVGDDVRGVEVVSDVLAGLADDGLPHLVASAADLSTGAFAPKGGRIDLQAVTRAKSPIDASRGAFSDADRRLAALDTSGYVGSLRGAVDELADQVGGASYGMDAASKAIEVLPTMLGQDEKRSWLLVMQNPAEIRSTGGMAGASALITTDDGQIEMVEQYTSFPWQQKPVLPLTKEERTIYQAAMLGGFWQNANLTPDFGRSAQLWAAHLKINEQQEVDGVLSIDPVALAYLLEATGPVTVQGVELTSDNAVEELLSNVYTRIEDPEEQNAFFAEAARLVFDKVSTGAGNPQTMLSALGRSAREHRLLVHSFDETEQTAIADTVVGQNLLEERGDNARIGLYLADQTMSKMSYYLDYDADVRATGCRDGQQKFAGTFTIRADTPEGIEDYPPSVVGPVAYPKVLPAGHQEVALRVYAPQGGSFDGVFIDGEDGEVVYQEHDGHGTATIYFFLAPQERREITFRMTSGKGKTGDTEVYVTPGARAENESSRVRSAC